MASPTTAPLPPLPQFKGQPGWEFTSLRGIDVDAFVPVEPGVGEGPTVGSFADIEGIHLVQVDGRTVESPPAGDATEGPVVLSLTQAMETFPELVAEHLGQVVTTDETDAFVARNSASWTGGAFVHVPRGVALDAPVVLRAVAGEPGRALPWRVLVVVDEGAEAEVWCEVVSAGADGASLVNSVVELVVGRNATLRFVGAQDLNESSYVFGTERAVVARDGALEWTALGLGGARGKVRMETRLAGEGADAKVTGAYLPHGRQHVDFDTTQEHAAPHTTSDLAFRGVLAGRSTAVWRGIIKVDPGAQQTDAFQESRNLLLSNKAHADAIPGLEILANDVRCTHAAAIARVDQEQLFYLRSRGLREPDAQRLVIEGFMQELVERYDEGPIREAVRSSLEQRLALVLD